MMIVPFLDVASTYAELKPQLDDAFERVMSSGCYILGEEVEAFETEFANFCNTQYAVGVGNGLDALSIALTAAGIGPGDEVIVPAHTFIATWLGVARCGAVLVPVDVDHESLLIDPDLVAAACTSKTAAVVPVHMFGAPVDPAPLNKIAEEFHLTVIGDAAQAHGASILNKSVGAFGRAAIFSFYPSKNLGAFGDGGAITTNDALLAESARRLRNYGSTTKYEFEVIGSNSRLDPLQAAFLRVKLQVLPNWNQRRGRIAARYLSELSGLPSLKLPAALVPGGVHVWYVFCVRHPHRDALADYLRSRGIQTQIHYPTPPHLSPVYRATFAKKSFPTSELAAKQMLSLPIGPHMTDEEVTVVIHAIHDFCVRDSNKTLYS